jgi:hypothetical protein
MIFVYLRDGQRIDVPDAVSVIHRAEVVFLNREGEIVRQLPTDEIIAYSRVLYSDDEAVLEPMDQRTTVSTIRPLDTGDSVMMPRRRHRRRSRKAEAGKEASTA